MPRAFSAVLSDLGRGQTHEVLTEKLAEVARAVEATGKTGTLTLTLTVKSNGDGSYMVTDDVKAKIPIATRPNALFFASEDGSLARTDPRQATLPLREVGGATKGELKEVAGNG